MPQPQAIDVQSQQKTSAVSVTRRSPSDPSAGQSAGRTTPADPPNASVERRTRITTHAQQRAPNPANILDTLDQNVGSTAARRPATVFGQRPFTNQLRTGSFGGPQLSGRLTTTSQPLFGHSSTFGLQRPVDAVKTPAAPVRRTDNRGVRTNDTTSHAGSAGGPRPATKPVRKPFGYGSSPPVQRTFSSPSVEPEQEGSFTRGSRPASTCVSPTKSKGPAPCLPAARSASLGHSHVSPEPRSTGHSDYDPIIVRSRGLISTLKTTEASLAELKAQLESAKRDLMEAQHNYQILLRYVDIDLKPQAKEASNAAEALGHAQDRIEELEGQLETCRAQKEEVSKHNDRLTTETATLKEQLVRQQHQALRHQTDIVPYLIA